ncbi:hypothetical protein D3C71_420510 [compost metagenome]
MAIKDSTDIDALLASAVAQDWHAVYDRCIRIFDECELPDTVFMECCDRLPDGIADTFLQVTRDAAGDWIADDSTVDGDVVQLVETSYTLFAIPVMSLPHARPTAEDFDILAASLRAAAGGDDIFIIPEAVSPEDFLEATPDALRYAVSTLDWNQTFGHDLDPLEHIVDRGASSPQFRLTEVVVGVRIERFVGGTKFIPANWVGECPDEMYDRFTDLLKKHQCAFSVAGRPMSGGRIMPILNTRLRLEDVVNEIATIGNELEVLPDVLIYEDEKDSKTFISLSIEGHPLSDTVIERRGSNIEAGDMAGMLRTFVPDVAETRDARVFTRSVMKDERVN